MGEEQKTTLFIEHVVKAITLIYGFLVFCGALHLHFYYNTFNINIFRYLDISEIAVSFLHIIIQTITGAGMVLCYLYTLKLIVEYRKSRIKKGILRKKELEFEKRFITIERIQSIWVVVVFVACSAYLFVSSARLKVSMQFSEVRYIYWYVFLGLTILITIWKHDMKLIVINSMIIFIMASVYTAISDVKETLDTAKTSTVKIITTDHDTITTSSTYYFVGRTNKYIFLYNAKDTTNIDIPVSEVKKISYR